MRLFYDEKSNNVMSVQERLKSSESRSWKVSECHRCTQAGSAGRGISFARRCEEMESTWSSVVIWQRAQVYNSTSCASPFVCPSPHWSCGALGTGERFWARRLLLQLQQRVSCDRRHVALGRREDLTKEMGGTDVVKKNACFSM